jgi:hypothetical protein
MHLFNSPCLNKGKHAAKSKALKKDSRKRSKKVQNNFQNI